MPYIKRDRRNDIYDGKYLKLDNITCAGDIQYAIAEMVNQYLRYGKGDFNYQKCNDVMGALAGAQQEFYREVVAPYENMKISENSPVYNLPAYLFNKTKETY